MAIITRAIYEEWAGASFTGAKATAIDAICLMMDRAVKNRTRRVLEQTTATAILDAPMTEKILLTKWAPVTDITVYYNRQAQGDSSAFAATDVLTRYTDYDLTPMSTEGTDDTFGPCILRKTWGYWDCDFHRPVYSVATKRRPVHGAVKVTLTGGYSSIPKDLIQGCCYAVSMVLHSKKYGFFVGSESWNGYSYNLPGVGLLTNGILGNPDVGCWINPYIDHSASL